MRPRASNRHADHPSIRRVIASTWESLEPGTRRKIIISAAIAAVLAGVDALAVGLLPTLVDRLQGKAGGVLATVSLPVMGALVVALMVGKSAAGAGLLWWESAFIAHDESERTLGLFRHLLDRPFGETSAINTSDFVRDLHISLPQLYRGSAVGLTLLLSDGLGLLALAAVIILVAPISGVTLLLFFVFAGWLYNAVIRSRISRLSVRMHSSNRDCLNDLNESFGGLKTLKAFNAEDVGSRRFTPTRREFALAARDYVFYTQIPRYYLEIALLVGLGFSIGVTYLVDGRGAVLASFGLLSGAAARAMPALSRALYSVTVIKVSGASVLALEPDLKAMEAGEDATPPARTARASAGARNGGPLVSLENVRFRYPQSPSDALTDITLEVQPGELVAILGESGAGKTTLVDVLIGLLDPQAGNVVRPEMGSVGYVAQETFVWDDSVRFNVVLDRANPADAEREVWAALEAARLADWVRSLPDGLDTVLGERGGRMSGGQRQRLGLARALFGHPAILVLDEPTSALDSETSRSLLSTLVSIKSEVGIIVVTHDPIVVEYSDRTVTLVAGAGQPPGSFEVKAAD